MKIDYYIADYGKSELYRHFHRCLANFIRNFANNFLSVNFNPEAVRSADQTRIGRINDFDASISVI